MDHPKAFLQSVFLRITPKLLIQDYQRVAQVLELQNSKPSIFDRYFRQFATIVDKSESPSQTLG